VTATLTIAKHQLARLHEHAIAGYPHEVVGILAGDRGTNRVHRIEALSNERADSPQNRYKVDGLALMKAEARLDAEGLEVVGYYHSHPDHPARYSDYDRDHALPNMSYLITSVMGSERGPRIDDTCCWRLREDRSAMNAQAIHCAD